MRAADDLRNAFHQYVDRGGGSVRSRITVGTKQRSVRWLLGQLWNCTDILPITYASRLDLPDGSTYAQAVRKIMALPAWERYIKRLTVKPKS